MDLAGRNALVLGLGVTGLSAARFLARRGAWVAVADTRDAPPGLAALRAELPEIPVFTGAAREQGLAGADMVVLSPGLPLTDPLVQAARARGLPVIGDVELFARVRAAGTPVPVIAITGANGKSTVTSLAGYLAKSAGLDVVVAGNIGLPVLDVLEHQEKTGTRQPDLYVLELSSFQLETTESLAPAAATVLNLSEDHMDRYGGMADYAAAKARVFKGEGVQVLNRDDAWSMGMALPGRRVVSFGMGRPRGPEEWGIVEQDGALWLARGEKTLLPTNAMAIVGLHNAANALAALALCEAVGLDADRLLPALPGFRGLPHRVEPVAEVAGVRFFDDSKGTNVGATLAALEGLGGALAPADGKVVLIAGGDGKGQDFTPLRAGVERHARALVLIGRDRELIAAALGDAAPLLRTDTLEQAVAEAFRLARPGDAVVLSPACASWDMFRNYEHRAEVFIDAVRRLPARGGA